MTQLPFPQFLPKSNWKAPQLSDLPDLSSAELIAVDTETYDPNLLSSGPGGIKRNGFLAGIAIGVDSFKCYLPLRHSSGNLPFEPVQRWVRDQLSRPTQPKVTANGGYDREWLLTDDIPIRGCIFDVQTAECLLNEEQDSYSLDSIAFRHLGEGKDEKLLDEAAWYYGDNAKKIMHLMAAEHVGTYAEGDVDRTLRAYAAQKIKLLDQGLWPIFQMESELSEVVHLMRQQGVRIDIDGCEILSKKYKIQENELYKKLQEKFFKGRAFDFNSGQDLQRVCETWNYHNYPRTKKGNPSFIGDWMDLQTTETCGNLAEFFQGVSKFRTIEKLRRDFLEGAFLNSAYKGRIHAQFNQMRTEEGGTRSGRFSCCNPNLQQVPKRSKFAKEIRKLFLPDEGQEWVKLDYSQQEYRIFVHLAMVMNLPGAAEAGKVYQDDPQADFHQAIADMTGLNRDDAKNWNFAAIYGAGIAKTAFMTKKTLEEAAKVNAQYHEKVPYAKQLAKDASARASSRGWIKTIGGRILHFETYEPAWNGEGEFIKYKPLPYDLAIKKWPNQRLKRGQTHKALNRYVQGSAADMSKLATLQAYKEYGYIPLMLIHDENNYNGDREIGLNAKRIMENAIKLKVPIYADLSLGPNWGTQNKVAL